jgi:hypothetical protein
MTGKWLVLLPFDFVSIRLPHPCGILVFAARVGNYAVSDLRSLTA